MKTRIIVALCSTLCILLSFAKASAQCPASVAPSYPSGCVSQYFTSITAGGTGVTSTISYSGAGCTGTYYNFFSTQGVTAPTGSTVNISISRLATYYAYLAVYVDWNNNGIFETTELVGTTAALPIGTGSTVYSFAIPLIGITTNTNLNMRIFLGEPPVAGGPITSISPPCSARWGESCDYYINATCTTPALSVSPASPSVCGPSGSIGLTASGAGPTPTYSWGPTTGLSPTTGAAVTSTPGVTTTYTVTGYGPGVCLATTPVTVTVNPPATPVITALGATTFCPGGSVTLSETSGIATGYQWYNGPAPIAGATNSTYTATPAATTTYSVAVTSATGCTGTASITVTLLAPPPAVITPAGPTTVCNPSTVLLNANFSPGYTYRWLYSAGVITGATGVSYTAGTTDVYKVEITDAAGCKDTSSALAVTIRPAPVATASAAGPLTFCFGDSVVLTAGALPGITYQWFDGATPVAGATNISYTARTVGTHDYRVRVTNSTGCSDITAAGLFIVTVNPIPVSAITPSGPLSFCTGGRVTLNVPSIAGYTYQWYYGATVAAATPIPVGGTSASFTAAVTGYYYVKLTSPTGCTSNSAASAALVTVVTPPTIQYGSKLNFCWGSNVTLSLGISAAATGITYQWMRNGANIPSANSNTYVATLTGSYTCYVNVSGTCIATTPPVNVVVSPLPNPNIIYNDGYLKTGSTYTTYQWYRNLIPVAGGTSYVYTPPGNGEYSVIVRDSNGCVSEAANYLVQDLLGVTGQAIHSVPVIYPNPANEKVFIRYAHNVGISVSSMEGRVLLEKRAANEIDISSLSYGVYIITLFDDEKHILIEKLLKQ